MATAKPALDEAVAGCGMSSNPVIDNDAQIINENSGNELEISYADGREIFLEGDPSHHAYIIIEGNVELSKETGGDTVFLAELGPGDVFGEMGLIDGSTRSATARTKGPVKVHRIDKDGFFKRLNSDSSFALPMINQLVNQLRDTSSKLAHQQFMAIKDAAEETDIEDTTPKGILGKIKQFFDPEFDFITFQPDAVEIERQQMPVIAKVTLFTVIGFFFIVILWASFSFVETVVVATGQITTKTQNIVLQPLETAMIRSINIKQGDLIEEGQVLATLDATFAEADVSASRSNLLSLEAEVRRLGAELEERKIDSVSNDSDVNALQMEIYNRRRQERNAYIRTLKENISQLKTDIRSNKQDAEKLEHLLTVTHEVENMWSELASSGSGSKIQYLSAKNQRLSREREHQQLLNQRQHLAHDLISARTQLDKYLSEWRSNVAQELAKQQRERDNIAEQLKKMERRESLVNLIAPARGIVLEIAERSVGSVIQQAEPMFTIVPIDVPLEMEAHIEPKDVGQVQVGDKVRVKLDALPFQKHGMLEGKVKLISEDTIQINNGAGEKPMYRSRIELTKMELREVPQTFRLLPGMTSTADITVGKRRIVTYFIYPLVKSLTTSFREP